VCVTTREGARGFGDRALPGLVAVEDVAAMADAIVELLRDGEARHRLEAPHDAPLARFGWDACAARQDELYAALLSSRA
jgi:glycosyltransferase involved in cell wall biosynthesis